MANKSGSAEDGRPPPYTKEEKNIDLMSPEARLQSLKDFAETQKFVTPGEDGTLQIARGHRPLGGLPAYNAKLPPPSYDNPAESSAPRRKSIIDKLLRRPDAVKSDDVKDTSSTHHS